MYKNILKIISTDRISSRSAHSAFTDLCEFNGRLICCYRQATNHVSGDGYLEVSRFSADYRVVERQKIVEINFDLRDPKMSIGPDGKIWLTAFARKHASESGHRSTTMMSWFSSDGISWSSKHEFGPSHWWLWRVRWHNSKAFSMAYNRALDRLDLYSGHPGKQMFLQTPHALSKYPSGDPT
ncbi:hypothetical protein CA267_014145 [Alteromonas pelagimontana]|uniref:Exo-alpha-sialidase n=1 Tax=Alteromonas pelagimontana TaxID=1858656 RepID=A0A6M4MI82_9ALTE|nr:hypothetical protein [Alteromonas pelagimontana]QJR81816.1 hypothetical protein CA267_014145 [Alteromonas pelagimontana]